MNSPSITNVVTVEAARVEAEPWPTPRPLACPPPPTLDLEKAIPSGLAPLREFCASVAEALQVPPDAVPPLALAPLVETEVWPPTPPSPNIVPVPFAAMKSTGFPF
jgi:hypothetical protein